jgi:hypothetical protein
MQILHGLEAGWCVPLRTKRAKLELRFKLIKCKLEGPVILPPACETVLKAVYVGAISWNCFVAPEIQ